MSKRPKGLTQAVRIALVIVLFAGSLIAFGESRQDPVVVPFENGLDLIFVAVKVNNGPPLWFNFDTGEETTLIDTAVADQLGLKIENPQPTALPGGTVNVGTVSNTNVRIGAITESLTVQTAPIGQLARFLGHRVDGIIGHDFIQRYTVEIDYQRHALSFFKPDTFKAPSDTSEVQITIEDAQVFMPATVRSPGHPPVLGKFKIDTGSEDSMGMNNNFVVENHLLDKDQPKIPVPGVALGGETQGYYFLLDWAKVGPITFERPLVGYTTDSKGFENRPDAGTIGSTFLSRFIIILDYRRKRILLKPIGKQTQSVPSDCSGFLLAAGGTDLREISVASVIPGSPGAMAGIQKGDQIVAVNGIPPQSLSEVWSDFRSPGEWHLQLLRAGVRRDVTLRTRPLLE